MNARSLLNKARLAATVAIGQVVLVAAPAGLGGAGTKAASDISSLLSAAGTVIGLLALGIGGGLAAYKASKNEEWTSPLLTACIGTAIAAVSF